MTGSKPAPWESGRLDQIYFYTRLRVRQWREAGLLVLVVDGHLGAEGAAEEFTALLLQSGEEPVRGVILDLRRASFLPSKALPGLIALRATLTRRGGLLAIVAPGDRLARVLGLVGMEKAILITPEPERALAAVRKCLGAGGPDGEGAGGGE